MALKSGGSMHTWTPTLPESEGVRTPTGSPPLTLRVTKTELWYLYNCMLMELLLFKGVDLR